MGKGGGGGAPASQTVTQTTVPEYLEPYMTDLAKRAATESLVKYTPYTGSRTAAFTPEQSRIQTEMAAFRTPSQFKTATDYATTIGKDVLGAAKYSPTTFVGSDVYAPDLSQYQMGPAERVVGQQYKAPQIGVARTDYAPELRAFEMGPIREVSAQQFQAPQMGVARTTFAPDLQTFQMAAPEQVSSTGVTARDIQAAQTGFAPQLERFQMTAPEKFGAEQAAQYMSPYQEAVTGLAKRQAGLEAARAQRAADLAAGKRGALGSSGEVLSKAERERGLMSRLTEIETKGAEAAFQQAQQQFERDRAAQMMAQRENLQAALGVQQLGTQTGLQAALANLSNEQQARVTSEANRLQAQGMTQDAALRAALANQQAGLTTAQQNLAAQLGVQQLGTQTGLQAALANLSSEQQANVQNLAAQLQTQGLSADQAMRAALANQQAQLTTEQQNLASRLGVQQLGTQTGLQTALANLSSEQQANVQNLAAQLQTQGLNADQALRAALANQQAGLTVGQQNLAALLGVQQLGSQQEMQAQLANQQASLERQRLAEQSRQFGAGLGLRGYEQLAGASQLMGGLGTAEQTANLSRLAAQGNVAAQQQLMNQQALDLAYQNFLESRGFTRDQLGFLSGILRGIPGSTTTQTAAPPSIASQLMGFGLGAYGLSRLPGFAKGGLAGLAMHHLAGSN